MATAAVAIMVRVMRIVPPIVGRGWWRSVFGGDACDLILSLILGGCIADRRCCASTDARPDRIRRNRPWSMVVWTSCTPEAVDCRSGRATSAFTTGATSVNSDGRSSTRKDATAAHRGRPRSIGRSTRGCRRGVRWGCLPHSRESVRQSAGASSHLCRLSRWSSADRSGPSNRCGLWFTLHTDTEANSLAERTDVPNAEAGVSKRVAMSGPTVDKRNVSYVSAWSVRPALGRDPCAENKGNPFVLAGLLRQKRVLLRAGTDLNL